MSGILPGGPSDNAYDSTLWDDSLAAPTQNSIRDYIEDILLPLIGSGGGGGSSTQPQCINVLAVEGNAVFEVISNMTFLIRNGTSEIMRVLVRASIEGDGSLIVRSGATVEVA